MKIATVIGCLIFTSAALVASEEAFQILPKLKALPIAVTEWGKDDYFKLKWQVNADHGIIAADIVPGRKEIWFASTENDFSNKTQITVLNAHGESLRQFEINVHIEDFKVLEENQDRVLLIGRVPLGINAFNVQGELKWNFSSLPQERPATVAVVPRALGGPLVVAGYSYGNAGLRALDKDGKLKWQSEEVRRAENIRVERVDGETVLAASGDLGRAYLVGLKGKVLEHIYVTGNLDRVMFEPHENDTWMFGLDSEADSWREKFVLYQAKASKKNKKSWDILASEDLGRITITAYTLGNFDGKNRLPAIGTDNGWVVLLDSFGKTTTEARFRGRIQFLGAMDLNNDGKDELIVYVAGPSGSILAFTRP